MALRQKVQLRVKKYGLVLSQINQKTTRSQGRPRPLPGHDTPNPAHNTYTLKCEEPEKVRYLPHKSTGGSDMRLDACAILQERHLEMKFRSLYASV